MPSGWGLMRAGDEPPDAFPDASYLILMQNWGNQKMLDDARKTGGEEAAVWWQLRLKKILKQREDRSYELLFSNALMGLKPNDRSGAMSSDKDYRDDCRDFIRFQLEESIRVR